MVSMTFAAVSLHYASSDTNFAELQFFFVEALSSQETYYNLNQIVEERLPTSFAPIISPTNIQPQTQSFVLGIPSRATVA
jgi:hypothetical protein